MGGAYSWMNNSLSGYPYPWSPRFRIWGWINNIEKVWSDLKRILSWFYVALKSCKFVYYAKEVEWTKKVSNMVNQQKIDEIKFIFNHISETVELDLFTKSEIEYFEKEQYDDEISDDSFGSNDNSSDSGDNNDDMDLDERNIRKIFIFILNIIYVDIFIFNMIVYNFNQHNC